MRATLLDLSPRMARAYGNNDGPRRDASPDRPDPARRIFIDDAARSTGSRDIRRRGGTDPARAFPRAGVGRPP
jgi:hypothetical protein